MSCQPIHEWVQQARDSQCGRIPANLVWQRCQLTPAGNLSLSPELCYLKKRPPYALAHYGQVIFCDFGRSLLIYAPFLS